MIVKDSQFYPLLGLDIVRVHVCRRPDSLMQMRFELVSHKIDLTFKKVNLLYIGLLIQWPVNTVRIYNIHPTI